MSWIKVPNALPVHNWANGGCSKLLLLLPCCLPNLFFQEFHEAGQFICQHCSQAYYLHQVHHGPPQPPQPPQTQPSSESFSQSTSSIAPLAWELPSTHLNSFTLCETRRVVKINLKGCKGVKLMESVVFWDHDIYYFLHCKKNSTY